MRRGRSRTPLWTSPDFTADSKLLTPADARRIVLATLRSLNATPDETFRAVLTADAESDWNPYAKHPTDNTWGLFQQNPKWWGTKEQILDPAYATTSFVVGRPGIPGLRKIKLSSDPVVDCWRVQQWGAPNPDTDLEGFRAHPATINYTRRLPNIAALIAVGYGRSPYGKNYGG